MACDFTDELSNGLKTGIFGFAAGMLLWLLMGEKKHGTKGYDATVKPKSTTTTTVSTTGAK